jgi:hypothetical protein
MPLSIEQIKRVDPPRWQVPTRPIITEPVPVPSSVKATGKEGFIRVQWAPIADVTGYRIAIMTDKELDTPNIGLKTEMGGKASYHDYLTGNIALTINFAVQAFRDQDYGAFSAIVSATSSLMTAAGAAAPASTAPPPSSTEPPASGAGGTTGTGRKLTF